MVNDLNYEGIDFHVFKKDYCKIEQKNVFCYENDLVDPAYVSNEKYKDCMDLLMVTGENKSHYVNVFVQ